MKGSDNVRPIVIKRKRVVAGDGHHGGAWKVAYADFVTAMMAFFLILWLLGAVQEDQRKGVADYFSATSATQSDSAGGDGMFGGTSLSVEESLTDEIATREKYRADLELLELVVEDLESRIAADDILGDAFEHVAIRMTDEGLLIEIFDLDGRPLFEAETDQPRPVLRLLTEVLTEAFLTVSNPVAIAAHARSFPAVYLENPVWPMTIGRAGMIKQLTENAGLPELRVHRVTGNADRAPSVTPVTAVRNNRIELILLLHTETP